MTEQTRFEIDAHTEVAAIYTPTSSPDGADPCSDDDLDGGRGHVEGLPWGRGRYGVRLDIMIFGRSGQVRLAVKIVVYYHLSHDSVAP